ncbi:hypothetical protein MHH60_32495 [Paenibacillus sp. FSL H7-0716]|uniref:Nucleoside 2-deoxyribosyltransferase n=1 Tax=Paenibacillus odorifer TaxID=189426 RepID=A0AB36J2J3_9BACL|nr:hypothetical protein [Paenibacillus odorifer]OME10027.1 hypothetical protein BSK47_31510 [Paenibacillus odorifer]
MAEEVKVEKLDKSEEPFEEAEKKCFIIMPIADTPGYDPGHFNRVYEYIIKPACINAGFKPERADDTKNTNTIILDILNQIVSADMAICDLSSKNPNVMYELGIRQAFNLPVVLLKDEITNRVFDTSHLRDVPYDQSLRIDSVQLAITKLTDALSATYEHRENDTNSLINILGIEPAKTPVKKQIGQDTTILLDAIKSISYRIDRIELKGHQDVFISELLENDKIKAIEHFKHKIGSQINHEKHGIGKLYNVGENGSLHVRFKDTGKNYIIHYPYTNVSFTD